MAVTSLWLRAGGVGGHEPGAPLGHWAEQGRAGASLPAAWRFRFRFRFCLAGAQRQGKPRIRFAAPRLPSPLLPRLTLRAPPTLPSPAAVPLPASPRPRFSSPGSASLPPPPPVPSLPVLSFSPAFPPVAGPSRRVAARPFPGGELAIPGMAAGACPTCVWQLPWGGFFSASSDCSLFPFLPVLSVANK